MDARSLVGMTMGARKRRARRDAVTSEPGGHTTTGMPMVLRHLLEVFSACLATNTQVPEILRRYAVARAAYHIGERLRPCRGCFACTADRPFPRSGGLYLVPTEARAQGLPINTKVCEGYGVLPAHKGTP